MQLLRQRLQIRAGVQQVGLQASDFCLALLLLAAQRFQLNQLRLRQALRRAQDSPDGRDLRVLFFDLLLRNFQLGRRRLRGALDDL